MLFRSPEMTTEIDQKVRMGFGLADVVEEEEKVKEGKKEKEVKK